MNDVHNCLADNLDLNEVTLKLHGNVTVQLLDDNDNVIHEEAGHNFISACAKDRMKNMMRSLLGFMAPNVETDVWWPSGSAAFSHDGSNVAFESTNALPFSSVVLSSRSDAEMPDDEYHLGDDSLIVGYADKRVYTGSDIKRGTMSNEGFLRENALRLVWTWANDRANGDINSVMLARDFSNAYMYTKPGLHLGLLPRPYSRMCEAAGFYWGYNGGAILYKIDKTTMLEVGEYTLQHVVESPIIPENGYIYYYSSGRLVKWEIATATTTIIKNGLSYPLNGNFFITPTHYVWTYTGLSYVYMDRTTLVETLKTIVLSGLSYNTYLMLRKPDGQTYVYLHRTGYYNNQIQVYSLDLDTAEITRQLVPNLMLGLNGPTNPISTNPGLVFYREDGTLFMRCAIMAVDIVAGYTVTKHTIREVGFTKDYAAGPLFSRKKLATTINKTSANKLKVIYDLTWA